MGSGCSRRRVVPGASPGELITAGAMFSVRAARARRFSLLLLEEEEDYVQVGRPQGSGSRWTVVCAAAVEASTPYWRVQVAPRRVGAWSERAVAVGMRTAAPFALSVALSAECVAAACCSHTHAWAMVCNSKAPGAQG